MKYDWKGAINKLRQRGGFLFCEIILLWFKAYPTEHIGGTKPNCLGYEETSPKCVLQTKVS